MAQHEDAQPVEKNPLGELGGQQREGKQPGGGRVEQMRRADEHGKAGKPRQNHGRQIGQQLPQHVPA
jgi:hypothetical protein